jgi:hemerythrin superfamily protein
MNIYQYLKKDHLKVSILFTKALATTRNSSRQKYQEKIVNELLMHAISEQNTFYRTLKQYTKSKTVAMHGIKEHRDIKKGIKILLRQSVETPKWRDALLELKETVDHHVSEEEGRMFQRAQQVLNKNESIELVKDMRAYKKKITTKKNGDLEQAILKKNQNGKSVGKYKQKVKE